MPKVKSKSKNNAILVGWDQAIQYFCDELAAVSIRHKVEPGEIIAGSRRKSLAISRAREELIDTLEQTISYTNAGNSRYVYCGDEGDHPISRPMVAKLMGLDHSAITLALKRHRARIRKGEVDVSSAAVGGRR